MPRGYTTCNVPTCGEFTPNRLGSKFCIHCKTDFPPKVVKPAVDEQTLVIDRYTRHCSDPTCTTLTRGNRCLVCRTCGKPLLRNEKIVNPNTVVKPPKVYTDEEAANAGIKRTCLSCGAFTPGAQSKTCRKCGQAFPTRKEKEKLKEIEAELETESEAEVESGPKPEISLLPKHFEYPPGYPYPMELRIANAWVYDQPCPIKLNYSGAFPEDFEVIEWGKEVRKHLLSYARVYLNNAGLFYYLRSQMLSKFPERSEEMEYLKILINTLPDIKPRRLEAVA